LSNIWLTFNYAGIEDFLILFEDFGRISDLVHTVRSSTEQG